MFILKKFIAFSDVYLSTFSTKIFFISAIFFATSITAVGSFLNLFFGILKAVPAKILIALFIALHVLDNGARILSLSLRLFGNIFGEHTVLMMVTDVALKNYYYVVPLCIPFLIFCMDVLFALIQTAVFVMLSTFYFKEELGVH